MFVTPQPLAGKISLAIAPRKDVKEHTGRNLWPPKGKVQQRSEDLVNFYIPHNKHQNSQVKKFLFFLSSITTTGLDGLLETPANFAVI